MAGVRAEHSGFMGLVVIGRTRETSSALVGLGLNVQHATGCRIMELCVRCTGVFLPLVEDRGVIGFFAEGARLAVACARCV
jgi:hypothetical protein